MVYKCDLDILWWVQGRAVWRASGPPCGWHKRSQKGYRQPSLPGWSEEEGHVVTPDGQRQEQDRRTYRMTGPQVGRGVKP